MRVTIRGVGLLGLLVAVSVCATAPASATPPEIVRIQDIHLEQTDNTSLRFPLPRSLRWQSDDHHVLDSAGDPTSVRFHLPFLGTLTNEATGESVQGQQTLNDVLNLENGTETFAELRFRAVFPGIGAVLLDAGSVVFDETGAVVFEAGPHQVINEDFAEFCAAFAS